jgi:hypothetical protein
MFERSTADARRTVELAVEVAPRIRGAWEARSLSASRLQRPDRSR